MDNTLAFADEMAILAGKMEKINSQERIGAMTYEEADTERTKIMQALHELKEKPH